MSRQRFTAELIIAKLREAEVEQAPDYLRSDNGPEFTATVVRQWLTRVQVQTLFLRPGSPWENGYVESFVGRLRDELLNREIFYTLRDAQVLIARRKGHYNKTRPTVPCGIGPWRPKRSCPSNPLCWSVLVFQ